MVLKSNFNVHFLLSYVYTKYTFTCMHKKHSDFIRWCRVAVISVILYFLIKLENWTIGLRTLQGYGQRQNDGDQQTGRRIYNPSFPSTPTKMIFNGKTFFPADQTKLTIIMRMKILYFWCYYSALYRCTISKVLCAFYILRGNDTVINKRL